MSQVVSLRFSHDEIRRYTQLQAALGCKTLSDTIRTALKQRADELGIKSAEISVTANRRKKAMN